MNISQCVGMSQQALSAFVLGALSAYSIFLLVILMFYSLYKSSRTDGQGALKYKPYLHSSAHITDVRS